MNLCPACGNPVNKTAKKGRPRIYCSPQCKEAFRTTERKAERDSRLSARRCVVCGAPIEGRNAKARCCSSECSVKYQNQRRGSALSQRRREARSGRPCQNCGQDIPSDRRLSAKFCSLWCQRNIPGMRAYQSGINRQLRYRITPDEYDALLSAQGGRCAICRTDEPAGKGGWHVDHCHDTDVIRGLLCHHCNIGVGQFKDDPARLRAAADYLERAPS